MTHFTVWFSHTNQKIKSCLFVFFALFSFQIYSQSIGVTSPVASTSYCAGSTFNLTFTISGVFSNVPITNVFSAEISDVNGTFAGSPVTIGTRTALTAGTIACTLPSTLLTSGLYRFRVVSSNPAINGSDNGANISIIAITMNAPTLAQSSLCQGETFTVSFTQSSPCNFVNTPATNTYSVELSNAAGSFTNPVLLGTRTATTAGTVTCTLPSGTPAGTGYRIRINASSPEVISPDNGSNITVMAAAGTPSVYGTTRWNVYCYNARNDYSNNYQGFYTENNLSFNTTARWTNTASPSSANAASGLAYSGCTFSNTGYSIAYRRTNIPCGYYQISIPNHRSEITFNINGTTVFQHNAFVSGEATHTIWTGVIETTDQFEVLLSSAGTGFMQVTFTKLNTTSMSPPVTVCANTTATLTVANSGTVPVTYSWTPSATLVPGSGQTVVATPAATTIYTVTAYDTGGTGCALFTNTVQVTVNPVPTTGTSITTSVVCSGLTSAVITATGANTYSWAPPAGLNTTTGNVVVASPTVATVYTVTGSNNCSSLNATRTVTVRTVPAAPSPTAFGTSAWNVYCYNGSNFANYYGYYTENNLSFASTSRWAASGTPSVANASSGLAYQGCNLTTSHGTISKRTNFTCGYYQVTLSHDDYVIMEVDNVVVFTHTTSTGDTDNSVWTGFLGPTSQVEITHWNATGNSFITASFVIVPVPALSPPVTICAGTSATLTAANISGSSYSWAPTANLSTATGTITVASPPASTNYTCTIKDAATSCTAASTTSVTVNPLPTTAVAPIASTINCQSQTYTLSATGANTYTWSPATGLSASTGNSVVASPTVSTIYTVSGSNNCTVTSVIATVQVVPLVSPTVFPSNTWNVYCYNGTAFTATNYYGYYTEDGSGPSGYDFNTATRWASGASPSTTSSVNGLAYKGCTMPATNWSMSFKRTGFTCNTYSITLNNNADQATIFINGAQVATRATSSATQAMWVGVLSASTTVEVRLVQSTGSSGLYIELDPAPATPSLSIWSGATSADWFTASNWCGSGIPIASSDVLIYRTGTIFQPTIGAAGAACSNLTISAAAAATSSTSAIAAAGLTVSGAFNLDVYGDWLNYGTFTPGSGTVNILGSGTKSIACASTQTFNALMFNNSGPIIMSAGIHRINSNMNLQSGIAALSGTLQFLNGSTVSNASDASFIEGSVVKFGNQAFTFPVGLGGQYRPISISAPALTSDNFTAQYYYTNPSPLFNGGSKDATIDHLSGCEYWILNRTGGSSIVYVTLSWDVNSCGVDNPSALLVARWDAGQVKWKDHGNGAVTGNTVTGTIVTSAPVTVFSPFTLGSKTGNNILPVELLDFSATCVEEGVQLKWSVGSEHNNDHFLIERSLNGIDWEEIKTIPSQGNTGKARAYSSLDAVSSDEIFYYRLSQVDKDLSRKTFKTVSSQCHKKQEEFSFFPNPASKEINLWVNAVQPHDGVLTITDQLGRTCMTQALSLKKGGNVFLLPLPLEPGVYMMSYSSGFSSSQVRKLVIR